jgi:hypothetical protein
VKSTERFVLVRHCHARQILVIADGLEVATDKKDVYMISMLLFQSGNPSVNRVQFAVAAPFNSDLGSVEDGSFQCEHAKLTFIPESSWFFGIILISVHAFAGFGSLR